MRTFYQLDFYYRSSCHEHLSSLQVLNISIAALMKMAEVSFNEIDVDRLEGEKPDYVMALPCLCRLKPEPKRAFVGPIKSVRDVYVILGIESGAHHLSPNIESESVRNA